MIGTMAMPDKHNSKQCRDLDGQIFPLSDAKTGRNYPPMHPWCRSLAVAVIDKKFTENMTRRATDPKTGEVQEIPYDMTYREWQRWQNSGKSLNEWQNNNNLLQEDTKGSIIEKGLKPIGKTADGIQVVQTNHFLDRMEERKVREEWVVNAIEHPLKITNVKYSTEGKPSKEYIGQFATVAVNPITGKATTTHRTHRKTVQKLKENLK